jgi:hypothetical protein
MGEWAREKNFPYVIFPMSFVIAQRITPSMTNDKSSMTNAK